MATDVSKIRLFIGDYNIRSNTDGSHEVRGVKRLIKHKFFNIQSFVNDIALLRLDRPVSFSNRIQPICLPPETRSNLVNKKLVVAGWGRVSYGGPTSPILQKVVSFRICMKCVWICMKYLRAECGNMNLLGPKSPILQVVLCNLHRYIWKIVWNICEQNVCTNMRFFLPKSQILQKVVSFIICFIVFMKNCMKYLLAKRMYFLNVFFKVWRC